MKRPWLAPLVPLYAAGLAWRDLGLRRGWEPVRRLQYPVISIGNLSTGGSGKTPLAITLAELLTQRGFHIDVLSRGYGRSSTQPVRVDPAGTADQFGDEPLLIAREAGVPVYVAPQRYDAGLLAEATPEDDASEWHGAHRSPTASAHILDDGFQHRYLFRHVDILLLSSADLRDGLLPAGDLRESLQTLQRATVLAVPFNDLELEHYLLDPILIDRNSEEPRWIGPVWRLHRRMDVPKFDHPVLAFCGIARPEQFFDGLEHAGLQLAARMAFRDHHRFTAQDVQTLVSRASSSGATALITTEKDAIRLGAMASGFPATLPLKTARLRVEIENETDVIAWLVSRLPLYPAKPPL